MNKMKIITALFLVIMFASFVLAAPSIPYEPYGVVMINENPAPDGLLVQGFINNVQYGSTTTQKGWYSLTIPADDPGTAEKDGGVEGDIVVFKVNGVVVGEGTWSKGTLKLDLTLTEIKDSTYSSDEEETGKDESRGENGREEGEEPIPKPSDTAEISNTTEKEIKEETSTREGQEITGMIIKKQNNSTNISIIILVISIIILIGTVVFFIKRRKK